MAAGDITGELVAAVLPDLAVNPLNVKRSSDRRFVRGRRAQQVPSATRVGLGRVGVVFLGRWKSVLSQPQGLCSPQHTCVCHALPAWPGAAWWGRAVAAASAVGMGPLGLGLYMGHSWPFLSPALMVAPPSSPLPPAPLSPWWCLSAEEQMDPLHCPEPHLAHSRSTKPTCCPAALGRRAVSRCCRRPGSTGRW